jgi:hypothetical protein
VADLGRSAKRMRNLLPILLFTLLVSHVSASPDAVIVSVDSLFSQPAKYQGQLVRTAGVWFSGFERSSLRRSTADHPTTENWADGIWLDFDEEALFRVDKMMADRFVADMEKWEKEETTSVVYLEVEGVFEHARNGIDKQFGHLNMYANKFTVRRILQYRRDEPNKAPVPTATSVTPAADAPVAPAKTAAHL